LARANGEGTIYKRNDGVWLGQITIGTDPQTGKQRRKTFSGKTRDKVSAKMLEARHDLMKGNYQEPSKINVGEWLDEWIEGRKHSIAYSTYRNYKGMIKNHLKPTVGNIKISKLTARKVQKVVREKLENGNTKGKGGLSTRTVKYIYQTLHAALGQAVKERIISINICEAVEIPSKQQEKKLHTWNKKEIKKFLDTALKEGRFYEVYFLALNTGMRKGELLGLKWEDVNLEKRKLTVTRQLAAGENGLHFKKVKTNSGNRVIPLTLQLVTFLKKLRTKQKENQLALGEIYQDSNLVLCRDNGKYIYPRALTRDFKPLIEKTDIPEIRFHDLRHTFATQFLEAGGNIKTLQQILGHSSISVTMDTYSHVNDEMLNLAAEKMEVMFNEASSSK